MKFVKLILLLAPGFILPEIAAAQTSYRPGYYVNNNSDTVRGLIETRATSAMGREIKFKKERKSKELRLRPGMARAVVVEDQNFWESFSFDNSKGKTYTGFFKVLAYGRITLYYFDERYFVKKGADQVREITKVKKVTVKWVGNDYTGLGTLKSLTTDCTSLDEGYLVDQYLLIPNYRAIVNKYNECFSEPHGLREDVKVSSHVAFGVHGAVNLSKIHYTSAAMSPAEFHYVPAGSGGAFISFFVPKIGDKFRLIVEPTFGMYNGYSYFEDGGGVNDLFVRFSYVRTPVFGRFFLADKFYIDLGLNNLFFLKQDNMWRSESSTNGLVVTSSGPEIKINNRFAGLVGGMGVKVPFGSRPICISARFANLPTIRKSQPWLQFLEFNVSLQLSPER